MTKPLTIEQHLVKKAYRLWMKGQKGDWYYTSPYICDNITNVMEKVREQTGASIHDVMVASRAIRIDFIQGKCLKGAGTAQEFMGLCTCQDDYKFGRDPRAIAFRHGLWLRIAEEYNVKL